MVKTKIFRLDGTILKIKKNSKKVIFSAYEKLLAEKDVLLKSKPLKIWSFGENETENENVSSWCDDFKKVIFLAYGKLLAEKHVFLNQNRWRYEIFVDTKKFCLDLTVLKNSKKSKKVNFLA